MTYLILDTSSDLCLIGLAHKDQILGQEIFLHRNLLSKTLLPTIQSLIEKNGINPSDLSAIAIGIGPGSYTGTRLGVAVGKSLAFGLSTPLKTFCSPLAFLPPCEGTFAFTMPTRSGSFFLLKGSRKNTSLNQDSTAIIPFQELMSQIHDVDFLISPSQDFFCDEMKKKPFFHPAPNLLTLSHFLSEKISIPLENVELLYLHTP